MKNNILKKILAVACTLHAVGAVAQSEGNITDQIASMEYKQWSFSPDWYYYNTYWGTVIDMPWPVPDVMGWLPGLGLHDSQGLVTPSLPFVPFYNVIGDNYVNERWRQMSPLRLAATAESLLQKNHVDDERIYWQKILEKDAVVFADRSTTLPVVGAWLVTKDERDRYSQEILNNLDSIASLGQRFEVLHKQMDASYNQLTEELDIIRNAHEDNADKLRQLQDTNGRLDELRKQTAAILAGAIYLREGWVQKGLSLAEKYRWNKGREEFDDHIPLTVGQ